MRLNRFSIAASVLLLLDVATAWGQARSREEIAFARVIVEQYADLLERRAEQSDPRASAGRSVPLRPNDEEQITGIRRIMIPQIRAGKFNIVVQPSGLIAVETDGRRIVLLAPNDHWDDEFRMMVKRKSRGNQFAISTIAESERLMGRRYPESGPTATSALTASLWHMNCPGGSPSDQYMRFLPDGTIEYGYSRGNLDQYHNGKWRLTKDALVLDFNNGYAIDTFPLSRVVKGVFHGSGKTRTGAVTIRKMEK